MPARVSPIRGYSTRPLAESRPIMCNHSWFHQEAARRPATTQALGCSLFMHDTIVSPQTAMPMSFW
jgi:hypothetical protein